MCLESLAIVHEKSPFNQIIDLKIQVHKYQRFVAGAALFVKARAWTEPLKQCLIHISDNDAKLYYKAFFSLEPWLENPPKNICCNKLVVKKCYLTKLCSAMTVSSSSKCSCSIFLGEKKTLIFFKLEYNLKVRGCLCLYTEESHKPLNQYGSPLQLRDKIRPANGR